MWFVIIAIVLIIFILMYKYYKTIFGAEAC